MGAITQVASGQEISMAEGIITLKKSGSGSIAGRISWSSVSNGTLENTSTITAKIQVRKTNNATTSGTWKGSFTVGDTASTISVFDSIGSSWVTLKTIKTDITHNADGTGTCYIYGKINGPTETSVEGTSVKGSETVTLDTIDRYAYIVSIPSITDEENLVVNYANPMGEALLGLKVAVFYERENWIVYEDVSTTESTHTINLDSIRTLIRQTAYDKNSITLRVILRSVIRPVSNGIYDTYDSTAEVLVSIVNADPVVSWNIVDTNESTVQITQDSSILIALHSLASVSIDVAAQKEASITSIKVVHDDQTLSGNGILNIVNAPIVLTVVDSRNKVVELQAPNTIIPYFNPTAAVENALMNAEGELPLVSAGTVYTGSLGATDNNFSVKYRYKEGYGEYGAWITFDEVNISEYDFDASSKVSSLDYTKKYTFQAAVFDLLHPEGVVSTERVFVSVPSFYWNDEEFRFNVPVYFQGKKQSEFVLELAIARTGDTMEGELNMDGNALTGLPEPQDDTDAATKSYADKKTSIELLWENASPTSNFAEQTIQLGDLSDYDFLDFHYKLATDNEVCASMRVRIGFQYMLSFGSGYYNRVTSRQVTIEANGAITFATAYAGSKTATAASIIPIVIYGIKGVTA